MIRILGFAPYIGLQRPGAGPGLLRHLLRAALLRVGRLALHLAEHLEASDALLRVQASEAVARRPFEPARRAAVAWVEAFVYLAMSALFVAGLVGVFIA